MDHDEQLIIEGLKRGDNRAYKYIYDTCYVWLYKIAFSYLKDDFLAQTLVGDVIFHMYEKRETISINTSLRSYLVRAVINRCLDHFKLKQQKVEVKFSMMETPDDHLFLIGDKSDDPHDILLEQELKQNIDAAVKRLPDKCRTVFEKSRFDGKSQEEIATEMAISIATVKHHIGVALSRLHKDLKKFL